MADSAAIYGLVGAVGGALLGAAAAVSAPMLQNRGAARARRSAQAEAEVNRLIKIRSSTRAVLRLHAETVDYLASGRGVVRDNVVSAMSRALAELQEAADDALMDGLILPQSSSSAGSPYPRPGRAAYDRPGGGGFTSPLVVTLHRLDQDIRAALDTGPEGVSSETTTSLLEQVAEAERLRGLLISQLLDRIETARNLRI